MTRLRRLIREVHRRSVWQVLGIYLVGAWIGYQIVLNVMQGFGLPDWVAPFALVLFVIGLPVVLATAFVQEGGPERADFRSEPHVLVPGFSTAADELAAATTSATAPASGAPHPAARHLTWPKAILGGVGAFLVLGFSTAGYMGLRSAGIGPIGSLVGKGELSERGAIVLASFSGADADLAVAVTEAFRVDFEQSAIVRLVAPQQVADALGRMQRDAAEPLTPELAREVAEREGYEAVLTGEVNAVGAGWVLSARLLAADGRVLASVREAAADSTQVLGAIDALSGALRERIGESFATLRASQPLEQVTTSSLEALRRYTQAMRVRDEGDAFRALELLQQAIAIDSGFAMAWRKIGSITFSPGMDPDLLVRATTRAWELSDRLTPRERHLAAAAYYSWVKSDDDAAMREYRLALDADPDNTVALNNLSGYYAARGDFAEAVRLTARAVEIGGSSGYYQNHAQYLYAAGRVDDARAILDSAQVLYPSNVVVDMYRAGIEFAEGRYDVSDSIATSPRARDARDPNIRAGFGFYVAASAAAQGRVRDALRVLHEMERVVASFSAGEALEVALLRALVLVRVRGDAAAALRELDDALARYPLADLEPIQRPYTLMASILLLAGEAERAAAVLAERDAAIPAEQHGVFRLEDLGYRVTRDARTGDVERAEAGLAEFMRGTPCDICLMAEVADAQARAGNPGRAIELYERYLAEPYLWRAEADGVDLGRALETLARLYDQRGDAEAAARTYARFIEVWQDADPELQPRVRAARDRLEAMTRRRG